MLQDKLAALITGANRGIGYEMVKQLAAMGFKVILASRDPKKGAEAAQRLAFRTGCFVRCHGRHRSRKHLQGSKDHHRDRRPLGCIN